MKNQSKEAGLCTLKSVTQEAIDLKYTCLEATFTFFFFFYLIFLTLFIFWEANYFTMLYWFCHN